MCTRSRLYTVLGYVANYNNITIPIGKKPHTQNKKKKSVKEEKSGKKINYNIPGNKNGVGVSLIMQLRSPESASCIEHYNNNTVKSG